MPQTWRVGVAHVLPQLAQYRLAQATPRSTDLVLVMSYMSSVSARLHEQDGQVLSQVFASGPRCSGETHRRIQPSYSLLHDILHQLMHLYPSSPQIAVCNVDAPPLVVC